MHQVLDSDLLEAARNGRQEAFTDLYRRHVGAARREARRRCRRSSAADDAVASAFAAVFRTVMNGGGPSEHFRAYLLTAVRNAAIDQSRRREVECGPLPDAELPDESNPEPDGDPLGAHLGAAFLTLPDRQRDALWRTEVEGRTSTEMAELLELSENAFAALKKRARQNLGAAYERELIGDGDLCTWIADRVVPILDGEVGYSHRLLVDLHVDGCAVCAALFPESERTRAPMLGFPLLLAAPVIRRFRGPAPTWWSGAAGPHAAAIIGVVAGVATVVGLVVGGGQPPETLSQQRSTRAGDGPVLDNGSTVVVELSGDEPTVEIALRRPRPSSVDAVDREHRWITGAPVSSDDVAPDLAGEPALDPAPDGDIDVTGSPGAVVTGPAPSTTSPSPHALAAPTPSADDVVVTPTTEPTATPTTTGDTPTTTNDGTTTTTSTTSTTVVPLLVGTVASTTTTVPPMVQAISTTTTTAPLSIGTISTTTTLAPLIGTLSP